MRKQASRPSNGADHMRHAETSQARRAALVTITAAAALPLAPAAASDHRPGRLGPNDARLCAIRDRRRALFVVLSTMPHQPNEDAIREPYLQEINALDDEALAIVPDDARGAAVQARLRYALSCGYWDNEMGDMPNDGEPYEWNAAMALQAQAEAIDPAFVVWPGGADGGAVRVERPEACPPVCRVAGEGRGTGPDAATPVRGSEQPRGLRP